MKFNLLYPLLLVALLGCLWIVFDLQGQSGNTFFGTAETESQSINIEYTAVVERLYVRVGQQVKKGDTLAIVSRSELDRNLSDNSMEINQLRTEHNATKALLEKDRDLAKARSAAEQSELEADINLLETEKNLQGNLRKAIGGSVPTEPAGANVKAQEIAGLRQTLAQNEKQLQEELRHIDYQIKTRESVYQAELKRLRKDFDFLDTERAQLVLISPVNGYVESIGPDPKEIVKEYEELLKINPRQPNKVIGFVHESVEMPLLPGDTVLLSSASRTNVVCSALLSSISSRMVELPFRLRKFTEMKTWGRELYIQLPADNPFYIGEKILITVKLQ